MSDGVTISPKHGVNPSMDCCFWCGEPKSIVLFGKLKDDAEAPMKVVMDYEPCDKCKAIFEKGIHVIGVSETPITEGMEPVIEDANGTPLYPDGTYFIANEDYIRRIYDDDEEAIANVLKDRKLLMHASMVHEILEYNKQEDTNEDC